MLRIGQVQGVAKRRRAIAQVPQLAAVVNTRSEKTPQSLFVTPQPGWWRATRTTKPCSRFSPCFARAKKRYQCHCPMILHFADLSDSSDSCDSNAAVPIHTAVQ
jgi:hypothetical protein